MFAGVTEIATVASASTVEAITVAVAVLRASTSDYSLESVRAFSEAEYTRPPGATASIVNAQSDVGSERNIALVVVIGCGCLSVTKIQIAVLVLKCY